jgi:molybdopterin molybdotransferase
MLGKKYFAKPTIKAKSEGRIDNKDRRRIFARVWVNKRDGQYFARLVGPQGSGVLTSMAQANGLMIVPEDKSSIEEGDEVQVQMLDWNEEM